jgi:hypothetical protein
VPRLVWQPGSSYVKNCASLMDHSIIDHVSNSQLHWLCERLASYRCWYEIWAALVLDPKSKYVSTPDRLHLVAYDVGECLTSVLQVRPGSAGAVVRKQQGMQCNAKPAAHHLSRLKA